jgi:hypothetical protein
MFSMQSDISRLEAKIERMDAQLAAKDRELATLTRTVRSSINSCLYSLPILNFYLFLLTTRRPKTLQL